MITPLVLRKKAETQAAHLPPLLARAEHLAGAVLLGEHGRRRAGMGDDFWQYRPAQQGDSRRMIDHRRSAMGDVQFVREREWQIAQSVMLWVDQGASMQFASARDLSTKIRTRTGTGPCSRNTFKSRWRARWCHWQSAAATTRQCADSASGRDILGRY